MSLRVATLTMMMATAALATTAFADPDGEKTILLALWNAETDYEAAFKAKLEELGVNARFVTLRGSQSRAKLAGDLRDLEPDIAARRFDVVYSWGTTATQMVTAVVKNRIPVVFNVVYDPVGAKLVDPGRDSGGAVTGVTNGVPIRRQFDAFQTLFPIKKLCVLFNPREGNANAILAEVGAWAAANGATLEALRVVPDSPLLAERLQDVKSGRLDCQVVYAGADSYLGSKAGEIHAAIGGQVKLLAGTARFVRLGWLAALAPGVEEMGSAAAGLVQRVLSGEDAAHIPVVLPTPKLFISEAAAIRHKVDIPQGAEVVRKTEGPDIF